MYLPTSYTGYLQVPVYPPAGVDPTVWAPAITLAPDDGTEPADGDYVPASWVDGEAALHVGPAGGDVSYPAGSYMAWLRLNTGGAEDIRLPAGRVRVGDPRTV